MGRAFRRSPRFSRSNDIGMEFYILRVVSISCLSIPPPLLVYLFQIPEEIWMSEIRDPSGKNEEEEEEEETRLDEKRRDVFE